MVEIAKDIVKENDVIILELEDWNSVGYRHGYANIELALPNDWEIEAEQAQF